jgi:hypothetical protein
MIVVEYMEALMKNLILMMAIVFALSTVGCNHKYVKSVQENLGIQHVYKRPTTAYGPGTVVMYDKNSDYTGTCRPDWIISEDEPRFTDVIVDQTVKRESEIEFDISYRCR